MDEEADFSIHTTNGGGMILVHYTCGGTVTEVEHGDTLAYILAASHRHDC